MYKLKVNLHSLFYPILILTFCQGLGGEPMREKTTPISTQELARQFKELRLIKGHFDGGTRNPDTDQWMGRKHTLMLELGERLLQGQYNTDALIQLLDAPDCIARPGEALYQSISNQAAPTDPNTYFLIYYWRGSHDLLFFTCKNKKVLAADWWYAGE